VPTVVVEGKIFCAETVNASPDIVILCPACLPRPRLLQISDSSEHNLMVRIEGGVVRIEGGVVKKCKSVVKTLKTVVKNKQFITIPRTTIPHARHSPRGPALGGSGHWCCQV
jgi:hypothetical protein